MPSRRSPGGEAARLFAPAGKLKPAPFDYHRPSSIDEALSLLARYEGDAKIIAGGQSLIPLLAFRLLAPAALIDIGGIADMSDIAVSDRGLTLGARVRWADIERSREIDAAYPMLARGVKHIAHYQIRNRGTVGGSTAHADPAAEFPALLLAHHGTVTVAGPAGPRSIDGRTFFQGLFTTDLSDDEIITEIHLPPWPANRHWAFVEFARRQGDFAIVGVALSFLVQDDVIREPAVVAFGVHDRPIVLAPLAEILDGHRATQDAAAAVGEAAIGLDMIDPPLDSQGTPEYRRALLGELSRRAVDEALLSRRQAN